MTKGKRREVSRGNPKPSSRELWVNSCGLTRHQVSNAVGKVLDERGNEEDGKYYLVRSLYPSPSEILIQEGKRIYSKFN
jgi:hypothetical protein